MKFRQIPYLKPDVVLNHLHELSPELLKERGISYLVFDVDDTLTLHNDNQIDSQTITHIKNLKKSGVKEIYIASNSMRDLSDVATKIDAKVIRSTILSRKPLAHHYRKILREINIPAAEIAMVGDRLTTDVLGGNLAGMTTILVTPLGLMQEELKRVIPKHEKVNTPQTSGKSYFADLKKWGRKFFDRTKPTGLKRTIWFTVAAIALGSFALLAEGISEQETISAIDSTVGTFLIEHRSPLLTNIFTYFTALAGAFSTILLVGLWLFLARMRPYRRLAFVILVATLAQALIIFAMKLVFARDRPDQVLSLVTESSYSFPSGHTMTATIVWGSAAYMFARTFDSIQARIAVGILYAIAVVAVATSRIYLGAHYLSDTLASIGLGLGLAALYLTWITGHPTHLPRKYFRRGLRWRIVSGAVITALVVAIWTDFFV